MFRPVLVVPPTLLPVTQDECKKHAVVDFVDDDELIDTYIEAATAHLDGFSGLLGRAIMEQSWEVERDRLGRCFVLPVPEVSSLSIHYRAADGVEQAVDQAVIHHHAVANGTLVALDRDYPHPQVATDRDAPFRVRFTCGYASGSDVPRALRVAIMMLVRQFYDDRAGGESRDASALVDRLIAPYRWVLL